MAPFDVLTASASDLTKLLSSGTVSSVDIVEQYLQQIEKYNQQLNALVEVAPREVVLSIAKKLDQEREKGSIRGPLHGVPIVVKVGAC